MSTREALSLAGAATNIIFVATKVLSRQTRVCVHKKYAFTNFLTRQKFCRDKHNFVAAKLAATNKLLSRQKTCFFPRDKHTFVATKIYFVAINTCLSRQKYACRDKTFVATKLCMSLFVTSRKKKRVLSRRKKHMFVATKIILVADPANDTAQP